MTVLTCGRRDVERGVVVRGSYALVSITDADKPPAKLRNETGPRGVLRLAFDDAEPPSPRVLMSEQQAAAVIAFAREHLAAGVEYLVVHCEQGASRSPAVAAALCEGLGLEGEEDFDAWYSVNRHVRGLVLAACGTMPPVDAPAPTPPLDCDAGVDDLLLSGRCATIAEAESAWLDAHLDELAALLGGLAEGRAREHPAVRLLLAHGSRPAEDDWR